MAKMLLCDKDYHIRASLSSQVAPESKEVRRRAVLARWPLSPEQEDSFLRRRPGRTSFEAIWRPLVDRIGLLRRHGNLVVSHARPWGRCACRPHQEAPRALRLSWRR